MLHYNIALMKKLFTCFIFSFCFLAIYADDTIPVVRQLMQKADEAMTQLGYNELDKANFNGNYEKASALVEKGVSSDYNRLLLTSLRFAVSYSSYSLSDHGRLADLWIEKGGKLSSEFITEKEPWHKYSISQQDQQKIIKLYNKKLKIIRDALEKKQREDSIIKLVENGGYEDEKYNYSVHIYHSVRISDGKQSSGKRLERTLKVDYLNNDVGKIMYPEVLFLFALALSVVSVSFFVQRVLKKKFLFTTLWLMAVTPLLIVEMVLFYNCLKIIYFHTDELDTGAKGKQQEMLYLIYSDWYPYNNNEDCVWLRSKSFVFMSDANKPTVLDASSCTIDSDLNEGNVIVSYIADKNKATLVSIDRKMHNCLMITLMVAIILLNYGFVFGLFNPLLLRIRNFINRQVEANLKKQEDLSRQSTLLMIILNWNLRRGTYDSEEYLQQDLLFHWKQENIGLEDTERIDNPAVHLQLWEAEHPMIIKSDNGLYFTMLELWFKVINLMTTHFFATKSDSIIQALCLQEENMNTQHPLVVASWMEEEEDILFSAVCWKFEGRYVSLQEFCKAFDRMQEQAGNEVCSSSAIPDPLEAMPKVIIRYYLASSDKMEWIFLHADDGKEFTIGELFFKLHQELTATIIYAPYNWFDYMVHDAYDEMSELPDEEVEMDEDLAVFRLVLWKKK